MSIENRWLALAIFSVVAIIVLLFSIKVSLAHDHDRPELDGWFNHLASGKGLCCSNNDGTALSDVDWESRAGKYRVRLEDQWWDVPDDAVITEPNRAGRTMVWPIYYHNGGKLDRIEIRCFMPGSMT